MPFTNWYRALQSPCRATLDSESQRHSVPQPSLGGACISAKPCLPAVSASGATLITNIPPKDERGPRKIITARRDGPKFPTNDSGSFSFRFCPVHLKEAGD